MMPRYCSASEALGGHHSSCANEPLPIESATATIEQPSDDRLWQLSCGTSQCQQDQQSCSVVWLVTVCTQLPSLAALQVLTENAWSHVVHSA